MAFSGFESPRDETPRSFDTPEQKYKEGGHADIQSISTYSVSIYKSDNQKYGLAYRVFDDAVTLMGVLPNSAADNWNTLCGSDQTLCAGDTIIEANAQNVDRAIVDELLTSVELELTLQKTGPRWHIVGDGAKHKEPDGNLMASNREAAAKAAAAAAQTGTGDDEGATGRHGKMSLGVLGWLYLFSAVFVPNLLLLAAFSDVGFGLAVFTMFGASMINQYGNALIFFGCMAVVGLVVSDWIHWKSKVRKGLSAIIVVYVICLGAICKMRLYPVAPLVIIFFHIPVFLGVLKGKVLEHVKRQSFYVGVTTSAISCAFFMLGIWLVWMNVEAWDGTNRWGDATKEQLVMDSEELYGKWEILVNGRTRPLNYFWDCDDVHKQKRDFLEINTFRYMDAPYIMSSHIIAGTEKENRGSTCARVKTIWFLAWTTPMICVGLDFIIGIFCFFNGVLINVQDTSKLEKVLKQFILMISFLVFTMYVSSSVAGASMRLTGVIMAFCASGLVALCVWLYMEIGRSAITSQVRNSKLMQSLIVLATSDWVRACVLIGCNVLPPIAICINMLNQWVRKKRGLVSKDDPKYTTGAVRILNAVQTWNWSSILIKANWLCMLYWTLSVGVAKLTSVFLSYLNEILSELPFVSVLLIFFLIGFTMFMLPPVPGIPVYICSGIVISARARTIPEAGNFWGGMCIAIVESLVLKICAVCGQYLIGYFMGKSVKVQQLVSVDKIFTRAIEQILDTRGLNLPKVSVLVGGPDWPTSVLCGILKLNLFSICIGTLPVIFVSAPCVVAGAFLANPDAKAPSAAELASGDPVDKGGETWQTLSTTALGVSFMLQLAGMVLALYYIQEVVQRDGEELGKFRPEHEAVAALTRREADYVAEYQIVLQWSTLLQSRKRLIIASTCAMLLSTFMFVMMDEACFRSFQVSSKIGDDFDQEGLKGSVFNLILPLGAFATVAFFTAVALHMAFMRWAGSTTALRLEELLDSRPPPLDGEDEHLL